MAKLFFNIYLAFLLLVIISCKEYSHKEQKITIPNEDTNLFLGLTKFNRVSFEYFIKQDTDGIIASKLNCETLFDSATYYIDNYDELHKGCYFLILAIKINCPDAFALLGELIHENKCSNNIEKGHQYILRSVLNGSYKGIRYLASLFIQQNEYKKAIILYLRGISMEDHQCMYELAYIYLTGRSSIQGNIERNLIQFQDVTKGLELMKKAANAGNPYALFEIGKYYLDKNSELAFKYLVLSHENFSKEGNASCVLDVEEILRSKYNNKWCNYLQEKKKNIGF